MFVKSLLYTSNVANFPLRLEDGNPPMLPAVFPKPVWLFDIISPFASSPNKLAQLLYLFYTIPPLRLININKNQYIPISFFKSILYPYAK